MADLWVRDFLVFFLGHCEWWRLFLLGEVARDARFSMNSGGERRFLGSSRRVGGGFEGRPLTLFSSGGDEISSRCGAGRG